MGKGQKNVLYLKTGLTLEEPIRPWNSQEIFGGCQIVANRDETYEVAYARYSLKV